jgi:RNA polymerase sigma-70 factor (ECF subfamily)
VLPHLDAAYNLARWLTRNDAAAQDVVQESFLRAFRFHDGFRGSDGRAWLLAIVRNTCFTWLQQNRTEQTASFDEELHSPESELSSPSEALQQSEDREAVRRAVEELPAEYREAIVLRELEGLSYKQIAAVAGIPIGTVMSRLARARGRLQRTLRPPNASPQSGIRT